MDPYALCPAEYAAPTLAVLLSRGRPDTLARVGELREISLLAGKRAVDLTPDELHRILLAVSR